MRCMLLLTCVCETCTLCQYLCHKRGSLFQDDQMQEESTLCRMKEGSLTRGIAIPAGGAVLLGNAWASIKVLHFILYQRLHSRLLLNCQHKYSLVGASQTPQTQYDQQAYVVPTWTASHPQGKSKRSGKVTLACDSLSWAL